jgi:hypothetical protein
MSSEYVERFYICYSKVIVRNKTTSKYFKKIAIFSEMMKSKFFAYLGNLKIITFSIQCH